MRLFGRFFRLVWGDDVPGPLRPVLAVQFCGSVAMSALWTYIGIWALERLDASSTAIGITFTCGALAATATGYLGGHLSDYLGRKPLILIGFGLESVFVLAYLAAGGRELLGLSLVVVASALGSLAQGADQALVADLVPEEKHEQAYASVRVASNLGVTIGPPIGGLLLLGEDWNRLFLGVAVMAGLAFLVGLRWLPQRGEFTPEGPPERGSFGVIRQDKAFLLFLVSGSARLPRLRLVRDRAADHGGRLARPLAVDVGLPRDHQPGPRHDLPAAADAARGAHSRPLRSSPRRCC